MSVQDIYNATMSAAREGMIANTEPKTLISRTVETAAGIGFGLPVAQGTDDNGVIATASATAAILGITVRERSVRPETPNKFAQYESARIMTKGVIWVKAGAAVAAGDPVYVTVATDAFVKVTGEGNVLIPNDRYDSSAASGALVKVRLG